MLHYIQASSSSSNNADPNAIDAHLDADHPRCTQMQQFKKWQASRSWLMCESNKVFCTVCRRVDKISQSAFVEGITRDNAKKLLKKIDKHRDSDTHKKSVECIQQADKKAVQKAFEAARRDEERRIHIEHEQTIRLFRTAYTVAKVHLSFSAYTELVELQILNGLDMGTLLFSDHACANIIEHLAHEMRQQLVNDRVVNCQ